MPTYTIVCSSCSKTEDRRLTFSERDVFEGACGCGGKLEIGFTPTAVAFTLRDGPSGGWASRAIKENQYRAKRREMLAQKEKDHVYTPSLIPNFGGQETGDWREAKEEARVNLGEEASKSYDRLVGEKA